jgi:crotonobetainyl-CoA:carnitine CoA-transferase CaiB-like acyl-CoA transferase
VRTGNAHPNIAPYSLFATGTSPIFLAVGNDGQFRKLCEVIGAPQLGGDVRFATNAVRSANRDDLQRELEALLRGFDGAELAPRLIAAGVPCGSVFGVGEALSHPHTAHRGMIVEIDSYRRAPPEFGAHTDEILGEISLTEGRGESK